MTRSEPRSREELEAWSREQEMLASEPEFFDYYDTAEVFPEADEEVDRRGRSLRTRVHPLPGLTGREERLVRVPPGNYRVELRAADRVLSTQA